MNNKLETKRNKLKKNGKGRGTERNKKGTSIEQERKTK